MLHASVRNKFDKPISLSSALHKKDGERGRANALPLTPFFRHLPRLFPQPRRRHRCLIIYWQVLFNGLASVALSISTQLYKSVQLYREIISLSLL